MKNKSLYKTIAEETQHVYTTGNINQENKGNNIDSCREAWKSGTEIES